jgi:hypothetical protein
MSRFEVPAVVVVEGLLRELGAAAADNGPQAVAVIGEEETGDEVFITLTLWLEFELVLADVVDG